MPQLALFNSHEQPRSYSRRGLLRKRRSETRSTQQFDLWNPEADPEKELALFFLDIRDFTSLTERYRAADVIQIVKKLFSQFQNIIRSYHGRVIETSGDGLYAAFGFDINKNDAVSAAVKAGMAILTALENLNDTSLIRNLGRQVHVGIGVHVGKVAVGSIQLGSKEHVVVMGYPVNVAARIQTATKQFNNNFIISSAVFDTLNDPELTTEIVTTTLKGMREPSQLHLIGKRYSSII